MLSDRGSLRAERPGRVASGGSWIRLQEGAAMLIAGIVIAAVVVFALARMRRGASLH